MILKFSSRDLEKRDGLYKAFTKTNEQQIVIINGIEQPFMVVQVECTPTNRSVPHSWYNYTQEYYDYERIVTLVSVEKAKSKQEIEAESAVEKAKASLESAKKVLESLKGIVN